MIGVDTNLLVRLFVDDGSRERQKALTFFESRAAQEVVFVSVVVLVELVWVLSSRYRFTREQALTALDALLANAGFLVEEEDLVLAAINQCRTTNSGVADNLIAALGRRAGCVSTFTFDKDAAKRVPGMELLA